jgi:hypothetical protein
MSPPLKKGARLALAARSGGSSGKRPAGKLSNAIRSRNWVLAMEAVQ